MLGLNKMAHFIDDSSVLSTNYHFMLLYPYSKYSQHTGSNCFTRYFKQSAPSHLFKQSALVIISYSLQFLCSFSLLETKLAVYICPCLCLAYDIFRVEFLMLVVNFFVKNPANVGVHCLLDILQYCIFKCYSFQLLLW